MGLLENYLEFNDQNLLEPDRKQIVDTIMKRLGEQPSDLSNISDLVSNFRDTVATTLQTGSGKW